MNTLNPSELKNGFYNGHGKCIIRFKDTHEWRKAVFVGHAGYCEEKFRIEPDEKSANFPEGGEHVLSLDWRWNLNDVDEVRLVPDEMWDWDVPEPVFSEYERLVRDLRARRNSGEEIHDESKAPLAKDWKRVCIGNDSKYGNVMYSPSLDVMRRQTMDEFYGGGIVD